jgi:hypothetical protein
MALAALIRWFALLGMKRFYSFNMQDHVPDRISFSSLITYSVLPAAFVVSPTARGLHKNLEPFHRNERLVESVHAALHLSMSQRPKRHDRWTA